jgi:lipoprotein-releasing system permease protein
MKLALKIAIRFLKSAKLQTLTIVLGIAVGVSVQIFIGSLIGGLQKDLINTTIGNSSQITIKNIDSGYINNYNTLINDVYDVTNNIIIASETIDGAGTAIKNTQSNQVIIRGFNFENANKIYEFNEKLTDGNLPSLVNEVSVGVGVMEELGLNLYDTFEMQVPLVGSINLTVVGVFDFDVSQINNSWIISSISTAQQVLDLQDEVTSIEMQIEDVFLAEEDSLLVKNFLNDENTYEVSNWIELNGQLLSGLQGQSTSSLMIQVFVMISVVLGIASVLAISVMQKSKQIGILKAMGIKDKDASFVFLFQGAILGLLGGLLGVAFGLGLAYMFSTFALDTNGQPIINLFIDTNFIIISATIATLASTLASLIPARKSSKLSVIEVIRNG